MPSQVQSEIWKDIDDNIFVCVVCMRRLKNPKLLPCLHRCCRACLEQQINGGENGKLKCLRCKYEVQATSKGADDFKTDFLVHNINEIDKIQKTLKDRERESCCNCTKRRIVPKGYCFNCLGYLCDNCRKIHEMNPALEEHRAALLTPEDLLRRDMNSKVMFSRISPKCESHQNKTASQCCSDCDNRAVCDKCMTESHRDHATKNVTSIVDLSKKELSKSISLLDEIIEDIKKKQEQMKSMSRPTLNVMKEKSEALMAARQKEVSKISNRSKFIVAKYENESSELDRSLKLDIRSLQLSMKEEMDKVKAKYDPLISERKAQADIDRRKLDAELERDREALNGILETLDTKVQHMTNDLFSVGRKNSALAVEMKAHFDQTILRYDDLYITAKSVLATESDWIALKCIPEITSAAKVLHKEINREFPSVDSLSELPAYEVPQVVLPVIENGAVSLGPKRREGGPESPLENGTSPFQRKRESIERKKRGDFHSQSSAEITSSPAEGAKVDFDLEKEVKLNTRKSVDNTKDQEEDAEVFVEEKQKVKSNSQKSEETATDTDEDAGATLELEKGKKLNGHSDKEDAASLKEDPEVAMKLGEKVKLNSQTSGEGTKNPREMAPSPIQSTHSVERNQEVDLNSTRSEYSETDPKQEEEEASVEQMKKGEVDSPRNEEDSRKTKENATLSMAPSESSIQQKEGGELHSQLSEEGKTDVKEDQKVFTEEKKKVKLNSQTSEDGAKPPIKPRRGSGKQVEFHSQISQESQTDPNKPDEVFIEDNKKPKLNSQSSEDGVTNSQGKAKPPIKPRRGSGKQVEFHSQINQESQTDPNKPDEVFTEDSKKPKLNSQSGEDGMTNSKEKAKPPIKPRRGSGHRKEELHSQRSEDGTKYPDEKEEVSEEQKEKIKKVGGVRVFPLAAV